MCKLVVEIRSSGLAIYQQIFQNADEVLFLTNSNDFVPLETTISKKHMRATDSKTVTIREEHFQEASM